MFVLSSDITIGKFRFSGVNEVIVKRSIHSIVDTAIIKIPSIGKIIRKNKVDPGTVITGKQFTDGDLVTIKLGYNGQLQTEFIGFVKRRNLSMPLEIECEGYSWLLRRSNVNIFEKAITVNDLLHRIVANIESGYKINVACAVDLTLENVYMPNISGFDAISNVSNYTDGALSCFFIRPDTLWCGLIYTPYANDNDVFKLEHVSYQLGYNALKDKSLKERLTENDPIKVVSLPSVRLAVLSQLGQTHLNIR